MNNTVAVVVTYNRRELLIENIKCLLRQTSPVDIIVIDNNSTDNTYEYIYQFIESKQIIYFNTGTNLGGAGGFNFGIKQAVIKGYDYIWIMDDDCMPYSDALMQLFKADAYYNGNYGFLSSKVLWRDGSICTMNLQRRTLTKSINYKCNKDYISVSMASFVSLFLKSSIVKEVGLPIKDFFIWTDDWEYTRRISKKYPCYVVSQSIVIHKSQSNIGANIASDSLDKLERYRYLYRNDVYLYRREGIVGFLYEFIRLSVHLIKILFTSQDGKLKRIKTMLRGTREGIGFKPSIEFLE